MYGQGKMGLDVRRREVGGDSIHGTPLARLGPCGPSPMISDVVLITPEESVLVPVY